MLPDLIGRLRFSIRFRVWGLGLRFRGWCGLEFRGLENWA